MCDGKLKILMRADASEDIGIGHVMRCFALAPFFKDMGSEVYFLCLKIPAKLERLLIEANMELVSFYDNFSDIKEDAELTANIARALSINWVVADGYAFDEEYQSILKEHDLNLMVFDDYGQSKFYSADLIVNPGLSADKNIYSNRASYTRLLLGPKYFPLRQDFLRAGMCSKEISSVGNRVLVTMGGSDPRHSTLKVIESLIGLDKYLQICVVIGPSYPCPDRLRSAVDKSQILLLQDVENMAALMSWADIGVSAGGGTLAEMAYIGLPNIIIKTADNQYASALYQNEIGTSLFLGDAQVITSEQVRNCVKSLCKDYLKRQEMSNNGRKFFDGQGCRRIFEHMIPMKIGKDANDYIKKIGG